MEGLDRELLEVFFDAECLAKAVSDAVPCPLEAVSGFLDITAGENKVEAQVGSALGLVVMVMLMQIGGVPLPSEGVGTGMWGLYMVTMLLQWFCIVCSLTMVVTAYQVVQNRYGACMKPFSDDLALMDVVAFGTFFFQPVVLTKLLAMTFYAVTLSEGIKLYSACSKQYFEWYSKQIEKPDCCEPNCGWLYRVLCCECNKPGDGVT